MIYSDIETNDQKNFIYLIDNANRKYDIAIKYTKNFIQQMSLSEEISDRENFKIIKTEVYRKVVSEQYKDFIKMVVKIEIPDFVLDTP